METNLAKIKKYCQSQHFQRENQQFWDFIKSSDFAQEKFQQIVTKITSQIDCTKCGNCCRELIPILEEEDVKRIATHLNLKAEEFISTYLRKTEEVNYEKLPFEFKCQPCSFLSENKCLIYSVRPRACQEYPHLDQKLVLRGHQFFANAKVCPLVFNVLERAKKEFIRNDSERNEPNP